jgi:hypothetical protein
MINNDSELENEKPTIIFDFYGIKLKTKTADISDQTPTTSKEVLRQIKNHLLQIGCGPTGLIADAVNAIRSILRGISQIPTSYANRINNVHSASDIHEQNLQKRINKPKLNRTEVAVPSEDSSITLSELSNLAPQAITLIQDVLRKYSDQGYDAYVEIKNDKVILVVGTRLKTASLE